MKRLLLLTIFAALLTSCLCSSGSSTSGLKAGEEAIVTQQCIGAIDDDSYDEMTTYCVRKDERGLEIMEAQGLIRIIDKGERGMVTDVNFATVEIRFSSGRKYLCAKEFVKPAY